MRDRSTDVVEFRGGDRDLVVAHMRQVAERRDGWMNLNPVLDEEDLPRRSGLEGLLAGRLPLLPVATWVPGELRRGRAAPASVGVQHAAQAKVGRRLAEAGLRPPEGWTGRQDHPRRGLIVEVPDGTDPGAVLDWLLSILVELAPVELDDDWRATFHHR